MAKNNFNLSTLTKLFKLPFKALGKARDVYVNSMMSCAGKFGGGTQPCVVLPRSFSANSSSAFSENSEEDLRELVKVASARALGGSGGGVRSVRKSKSVKIGRIDENESCDKFDDEKVKFRAYVFPRSRSCAASTRALLV